MSQHDLDIANQGFPATRADINNALQALGSSNSGATAPSTTYANQLWYDTANNILKIRNEDNDAWISLLYLDQTNDAVAQFDVDNIRIDGNTISSTDTNGDITLDPNGTGDTIIASGNLGLGTTSPNVELEISGSSEMLRLQSTDTNKASIVGRGASDDRWLLGTVASNDSVTLQATSSTGELLFKTGGTNERMRITSGGNVGIGDTTPSRSLVVKKTSGNADVLIETGTGNASQLLFGDTDAEVRGYVSYAHGTDALTLGSAGSDRLKIDSSGNLIMSSNSGSFDENGNYNAIKLNQDEILTTTTTTVANTHFAFSNPNGRVGSITTSGSGTAYNTSSDHRLKENVADMTGAIDRVKALAPKRFNFIADDTVTVDGFLAHEAQAVVPEAVTGTKDAMRDEQYEVTPAVLDDDGNVVTEAVMGTRSVPDYQGIDQSKLVPLLTGALQEAITKIESLETRIAALEA